MRIGIQFYGLLNPELKLTRQKRRRLAGQALAWLYWTSGRESGKLHSTQLALTRRCRRRTCLGIFSRCNVSPQPAHKHTTGSFPTQRKSWACLKWSRTSRVLPPTAALQSDIPVTYWQMWTVFWGAWVESVGADGTGEAGRVAGLPPKPWKVDDDKA